MTSCPPRIALFVTTIWLLLLTGCQQESVVHPAGWETFFPMQLGSQNFEARLAVLPQERANGLMFIESLGEQQGMLFFSQRPEPQSFWMRNTRIPLDIGYFDAQGQLLEIHPMYPHDETPVKSRSSEILFALEMPQGWFRKHQLFPDQRPQLHLPLIRQALDQRGLSESFRHY